MVYNSRSGVTHEGSSARLRSSWTSCDTRCRASRLRSSCVLDREPERDQRRDVSPSIDPRPDVTRARWNADLPEDGDSGRIRAEGLRITGCSLLLVAVP